MLKMLNDDVKNVKRLNTVFSNSSDTCQGTCPKTVNKKQKQASESKSEQAKASKQQKQASKSMQAVKRLKKECKH